MPNNFRLTGNYYISKAGHDSNDALAKDTPKKSIPNLINGSNNVVIGSGYYTVGSGVIFLALSVYADGIVYVDFQGNATIFSAYTSGGLTGFFFLNATNFNGSDNNNSFAINCVFKSISNIYRTFASINRCIFIDAISSASQIVGTSGSAILINTTFPCTYLNNVYADTTSVITTISVPAQFRNNNIQGTILLGGIKYAIKDQYTGTPQDAGYAADVYWLTEANLTANGYTGTIAGWNAAVASCINRDPRFNDVSKMDFTLKADSPHIGRATDGISNIGGTQYAQSFYAGGSNPNILLLQPSAEIDITTNPTDWRLYAGQTQGSIRAIVKASNSNEVISAIPYIGNYAFNSDTTPGTSTNFNVPDSKPLSNGYPSYQITTGAASDAYRVIIANHGYQAGVWIKVDGQYREITSVTTNELIFLTAVRATVGSGTALQVGSQSSLTSLNPNRLGFRMRSSKLSTVDASNWDSAATWDNDSLAPAGNYLEQEWNRQPMIDNLNQVGFGDDNYDSNYGNAIQLKYIDIIIYLRNDYKS